MVKFERKKKKESFIDKNKKKEKKIENESRKKCLK